MSEGDFRQAFEALVPEALQCAYDYVDHDDAVETIWIVGDRDGDWASGSVFYRVSGEVVRPGRMGVVLPGFDDSVGHQEDLDPATDTLTDLLLLSGVRAQNPTRVVIRYDIASQAMNADFSYEPLTMGSEDTLTEVADRWFRRLETTGNDSAAD